MRFGAPSVRLFLIRLRPRRAELRFTGHTQYSNVANKPLPTLDTFRGSYPLSDENFKLLCQCVKLHGLILISTRLPERAVGNMMRLQQLATFQLHSPSATNLDQLKMLGDLTSLRIIKLDSTPIADSVMESFHKLPKLETLSLVGTKITDQGISHLSKCRSLEELNLSQTKLTDSGLIAIANLPLLKSLDISSTDVTLSGIQEFLAASNVAELTIDLDYESDLEALRKNFPKPHIIVPHSLRVRS